MVQYVKEKNKGINIVGDSILITYPNDKKLIIKNILLFLDFDFITVEYRFSCN